MFFSVSLFVLNSLSFCGNNDFIYFVYNNFKTHVTVTKHYDHTSLDPRNLKLLVVSLIVFIPKILLKNNFKTQITIFHIFNWSFTLPANYNRP